MRHYPRCVAFLLFVSLVNTWTEANVGSIQNDRPYVGAKPLLLPQVRFTQSNYNLSIPENCPGQTLTVLTNMNEVDRMGIELNPALLPINISYSVTNDDQLFSIEDRLVGNFCFLTVQTRRYTVLNRERKDKYLLSVRATAVKREGNQQITLNADTTITIHVLDTNDLNPLFYPSNYEISLEEDTPVHRSFIKVTAEDADLGLNGEIYFSFLEQTNQFAIHPTSGVITLTKPLIYAEKTFHELIVLAQDRGIKKLITQSNMSRAKVQIHVLPSNFYSPEVHIENLGYIDESRTRGNHIYSIIRVTDKDKGIHGMVKSVEIINGDPDGHFRIRPTKIPNEFNLEVLRSIYKFTAQEYNITIKVTDRGTPSRYIYKSIPVSLVTLKKPSPIFSHEIYEVKISEVAPINSPVIRLKIQNVPLLETDNVNLEIVGGNEGNEFRINTETGMLYTNANLDAEGKSTYILTVSAIDQRTSDSRRQSSAKVKVYVQDANDNDPIFDVQNRNIPFKENEPIGTSVTKVTARDMDSGENGYISYSLANLKPIPFEIDHFTGVIKVNEILDYESARREYTLLVRASDWGQPYRRQTETQIKIMLQDINDNRPEFERINCTGTISRFIPIGTELITLQAVDLDREDIARYLVENGNEDACFSLDSNSGTITLSCDLSDLLVNERTLSVTATDGNHYADTMNIKIYLSNDPVSSRIRSYPTAELFECVETGAFKKLTETLANGERHNIKNVYQEEFGLIPSRYGTNIHTPEFDNFPNELQINESVALGTTVGQLKARDRDLGYNGLLIFGISNGDDDSVFCVDPDSGELKIIGYLDREREDEYYLNITILDLGQPQKSSSKILPVVVKDVNDNPPTFLKSFASFRVSENALNGTELFKAIAKDPDLDVNGKITYTLVPECEQFSVNSNTGALTVSGVLDRESKELYEFKIRAQDNGVESLYSEATIKISVDDVNDNSPVFSLPSYSIYVREDIPVGSFVAVITASDPDLGAGGEVVYDLDEEEGFVGTFKIDSSTGVIRTEKLLDYEERQVYTVTVSARDKGVPSLSSETEVILSVVDVNENIFAPKFSDFVLEGLVLENQAIGTKVMEVTTTDADTSAEDSTVSYFIVGGDGVGYFNIDSNGIIKTTAIFDAETKDGYWLTVVAEDHAVVPLQSSVQVFIRILNINDNVPLSNMPIYFALLPENGAIGTSVTQISASDADNDAEQNLMFRMATTEKHFAINPKTGEITLNAHVDRETQDEHLLEITITDNGKPYPLSSTTRIVITIDDVNDNDPEFEQKFYKVQVAATRVETESIQDDAYLKQSDSVDLDWDMDGVGNLMEWKSLDEKRIKDDKQNIGLKVYQVIAFDKDTGLNSLVHYSMKSKKGTGLFNIHPTTGVIYSTGILRAEQEFELLILAEDSGTPTRNQTCRISLQVVAIPTLSRENSPPIALKPSQTVDVTENDSLGFLVALIQGVDPDNDTLWFDIVDGDPENNFFIGRDNGNILLAKKLDYERQTTYNLTISITDTIHTVPAKLQVNVLDMNDNRPTFDKDLYEVDVSEAMPVGMEVLKVQASDLDRGQKLFYSIHNGRSSRYLDHFKIDTKTGAISLAKELDRETIDEYLFTIMVRDDGTPTKRNYARVHVNVHDHNDHSPRFAYQILQGRVYELAAVGSTILRARATDRDRGDNARISYSITSGNIGNVFKIDALLGNVKLAKELNDSLVQMEFTLQIKATDHGNPPLSTYVPAHIMITQADNMPPKFAKSVITAQVYENTPIETYVTHVESRSVSSLTYEITTGNIDFAFSINPSTGVIFTQNDIDFERMNFYNLTITATNMAHVSSACQVLIQILDQNDNTPVLQDFYYEGFISENAAPDSLVLINNSAPLVIRAFDADSEKNSILHYEIVEFGPRQLFGIEQNTGTVRNNYYLDFEKVPEYLFHVIVYDSGKPVLTSETMVLVKIKVIDVNDNPPIFPKSTYNVTILLPTYHLVPVLQVNATDVDTKELKYEIIDGNLNRTFKIDAQNGLISVLRPDRMKSKYKLHIRVSDGIFTAKTYVEIKTEIVKDSTFRFSKSKYEVTTPENSTKIVTLCVVNVIGTELNEHVTFSILSPTELFTIGGTSGALVTAGKRFDREETDHYELIVQAESELNDFGKKKVARVVVKVAISDVNDNCPVFFNLPYVAVVSAEDRKGKVILKLHAVDADSNENGEVRYELSKGHGELFRVNRQTGEIELKQSLSLATTEYNLTVAAYDSGSIPCFTEEIVNVKVVDRSTPVFRQKLYQARILEDMELYTPLALQIEADSPMGRKLVYSIVSGDETGVFNLDFNAGFLSLVDELDFEKQPVYELSIRAMDSISGSFADVPVILSVDDVNDNAPEFTKTNFNATLSEATEVGTKVLKIEAKDNDEGKNGEVRYFFHPNKFFRIDKKSGNVFMEHALDYEVAKVHHFLVEAKDLGTPSLSSFAHVWIHVLDVNDNPPKFEHKIYNSSISSEATRGHLVVVVRAHDNDESDQDNLEYNFVSGNEQQIFGIDSKTGLITLQSINNFGKLKFRIFNISVTDGVYTSFATLKIFKVNSEMNSFKLPERVIDAEVPENKFQGFLITKITPESLGFDASTDLTYSIKSEIFRNYFSLDSKTGELFTKMALDRENQSDFDVLIRGVSESGSAGFVTVNVHVTDVNDNAPVFLMKDYRNCVRSNWNVDVPVLKVEATDQDTGLEGKVEYHIHDERNSDTFRAFSINSKSGELFLTPSLGKNEPKSYQFFIRAKDNGLPSMHSDVPVSICILSPGNLIPAIELDNSLTPWSEYTSTGTILSTVKLSKNITNVQFRIVTQKDTQSQFSIDSSGNIFLSELLDYEKEKSYTIGIVAEITGEKLVATMSQLHLIIVDENDNAPQFETNPYIVTVLENVEEGTPVLKVMAHDLDSGENGQIFYVIESKDTEVTRKFSVDPKSGWISTLSTLDREQRSEYKFQILAHDNGNPRLSTRTTVIIKLKDVNDNPMMFSKKLYEVKVLENAPRTLEIAKLVTVDLDKDIYLNNSFFIANGDRMSHFAVDNSGSLTVMNQLDRETTGQYVLDVVVTDDMFSAATKVFVEVGDVNDNPPICSKLLYRKTIPENINSNTTLLNLNIVDLDQATNHIILSLTGSGADKFQVDSETMTIKTKKHLDREKVQKYQLFVTVGDRDRPEWSCTSEVDIVVSDVNDNAPKFSMDRYSVVVAEDASVGLFVTRIHAVDIDSGDNGKIKYQIHRPTKSNFKIDATTGIVTLQKELDREIQAFHNLTVKAVDYGKPPLSSSINVIINVQDVNDNPPEFSRKFYNITISETTPIGTEILKISATSKDLGKNAEIYYSIVSANTLKVFSIHQSTGVMIVTRDVDYERNKEYMLTVQATDSGDPPLSNLAVVNITIEDSNDNPPHFSQKIYHVVVSEDASEGDQVLQVVATDADSGMNGKVIFEIDSHMREFTINLNSGIVTVSEQLDYETKSKYSFKVKGKDLGVPQLWSEAEVVIEILDANDNVPQFSQAEYTIMVQEDKPIGYNLLKFNVTDLDSPLNAGPFTFDFIGGNELRTFTINQDNILQTSGPLSFVIRNSYKLHVRVFDNGIPPLFSDTIINVKIIAESRYRPKISPSEFFIRNYKGMFSGKVVGKIHAYDQDPYDNLRYALNTHLELFDVNQDDGTLMVLYDIKDGEYLVNVSVTDGKYETWSNIKVTVDSFTDNVLTNALIIKFREITPELFLLNNIGGFTDTMSKALNVRPNDVLVITLQESDDELASRRRSLRSVRSARSITPIESTENSMVSFIRTTRQLMKDLDVVFAVKKVRTPHGVGYFTVDQLRKAASSHVEALEESTKLIVEQIVRMNKCLVDSCGNGKCWDRIQVNTNKPVKIATELVQFSSLEFEHTTQCVCKKGYGGTKCDIVINQCAMDPCSKYETCIPDTSPQGYTCQCIEGQTGENCETDPSQCTYHGCYLPNNPISFSGRSFAQYKVRKLEDSLTLSLRIRTLQSSGTIMHASGVVDYNILELQNGLLQYRFELGQGEGLVKVSSVFIADGQWHSVKLERDGNNGRISVDNTHVGHGKSPGTSNILNIQENDFYLGAQVRPHPSILGFEDIRKGFFGCMDDLRISQLSLPLHKSGTNSVALLKRFTNIEFGCDTSSLLLSPNTCEAQPCQNGGTCSDSRNGSFECSCPSRFVGSFCEIDTNPCLSRPCLFDGVCKTTGGNAFECECKLGLTGRRCEYGFYCNPNPCQNGGVCEEGDDGPVCKCQSWTGTYCQDDLNECQTNPCQNGGTCVNEVGSYKCYCAGNATGLHCGTIIVPSNSLTVKLYNMTLMELLTIVGILSFITLFLLVCISVQRCNRLSNEKKRLRSNNIINRNDIDPMGVYLSSQTQVELQSLKYTAKMCNLELTQDDLSAYESYGVKSDIKSIQNNLLNNELENRKWSNLEDQHRVIYDGQMIQGKGAVKINNFQTYETNDNISNNVIHASIPCSSETMYDHNQSHKGYTPYDYDCAGCGSLKRYTHLPDIAEIPSLEAADSLSNQSNESYGSKSQRGTSTGTSSTKRVGDLESDDTNQSQTSHKHFDSDISNSGINTVSAIMDPKFHSFTDPDVEPYGFPSSKKHWSIGSDDGDVLRVPVNEGVTSSYQCLKNKPFQPEQKVCSDKHPGATHQTIV